MKIHTYYLSTIKILEIADHNANPHKTYEMGINQLIIITQKAFVENYLGYKPTNTRPLTIEN
jgi:hypothetical protein